MQTVAYRDLVDAAGVVWRVTAQDGVYVTTSQAAGTADPWFITDTDGATWEVTVETDGTLVTQTASGDAEVLYFEDAGNLFGAAVTTDGTLTLTAAADHLSLIFEAAFGVGPGTVPDPADWVDLSGRLMARGDEPTAVWEGGRQTELDRMEAQVGEVLLDNSDRALDPTYDGSPYWPDVVPMVRVRLRATDNFLTYDVFEGFVESWPQHWEGKVYGIVPTRIVDGTKLLSLARTSAEYFQQGSGARVDALLDAADWPADKRNIDGGQSQVQGRIPDRREVINEIRDTEEAESGIFFIGPSGDATFRDRRSRIVGEVEAEFGGAEGELGFQELDTSFDDEKLWNDIAVKPDGITIVRTEDDDSILRFGRRSRPEFGALITSSLEATDRANWELNRSKDPVLRIEQLELVTSYRPSETADRALGLTFGDRVIVRKRPHGIGDPIEQESIIEHIRREFLGGRFVTTWRLSPASTDAVWLVGIEGFSEVGETTRLGY